MHPYATGRPPTLMYWIAAGASLVAGAMAWGAAAGSNTLGLSIGGPSGVAVFLGLYWFFDTCCWKWGCIRRHLLVPNLNGTWACDGLSMFRRGRRVDYPWTAEITIRQSWTRIIVRQRGAKSKSRSVAASLRHEPGAGYRLIYQYENEPELGEPELDRHFGTCDLVFDEDGETADGRYFTDWPRMTAGQMLLTRKDSDDGQAGTASSATNR